MNAYTTEIIEAHIAIESWLSEGKGDPEALLSRFDSTFTMVTPGGACLDNAALNHFFLAHRGARPGLKIEVENIETVAQWSDGAALRYQEKHTLPEQAETRRWSTVVFKRLGEKILWRHLHETAQA